MSFELYVMDVAFLSAIVPHIDKSNVQNLRFDFHLFLLCIWFFTKYVSFVRRAYQKRQAQNKIIFKKNR